MNILREESKDTTILIFEGAFTIYNVVQIKDELFAGHENLADKVAFDLAAVSEIDTAGVQLLLCAKTFFSSVCRPLFISKSNESVDSILTALDINAQFAMES